MQTRTATAIAHPNIAFIKYWGNRDADLRIPANGSISMNLDRLYTQTRVNFDPNLTSDQVVISDIFYHNDEQRMLALETRALEEKRRNKRIQTEIVPFGKFYLAEDYHQKYGLRGNSDLMREFKAMYPRDIDFINSTAAARVNGYIGGYGSPEEIKATIENLGLSTAAQERLLGISNKWKN